VSAPRSVGKITRAKLAFDDPPQELVGDQLVDLLSLDRLVAHRHLLLLKTGSSTVPRAKRRASGKVLSTKTALLLQR